MSLSLTQTLINASSHEQNVRMPAEAQLKELEEKQTAQYLIALCQDLLNDNIPEAVRQLAGLQLKNALYGKSEHESQRLALRWLSDTIPNEVRQNIKRMLVQTLGSTSKPVRSTAALVVAKIASIEVPKNLWPEIIHVLVQNITQPSPDPLKEASFEALGYICEECPEPLQDKSPMILNAIGHGMRDEQKNNAIKLAATKALANSLEFVKANFAIKTDRDEIMKMVFSATQSPDENVRKSAYECLVEIAQSYYEYLPEYIEPIFRLTANAIQKEAEGVALQAIEFWSTICDEEIVLMEEEEDAQFKGQAPENKNHKFMHGALAPLMPMIFECLTKQSEEEDDDTWNTAMASGTCMGLVAQATGDAVMQFAMPFIERNIQNPNWRHREAAVLTFGSILDGPSREKLKPLVQQAFPLLLNLLKDQSTHVKDSASWTVGRICQLLPETVEKVLPQLMNAVVLAFKETPKVASNACWAVHNLGLAMEIGPEDKTSPLSPYFQGLMVALLATSERPDVADANLLTSVWEAINTLIHTAAQDMFKLVGELVPALIAKLQKTLQVGGLSGEERENQNMVQAYLCSSLQVVIQKLDKSVILPQADTLMILFLQVLQSKTATVHQEAMHAIGALATRVGEGFAKYMMAFQPFLQLGLQNAAEHQVCMATVGVVSELSRALGPQLLALCDCIMKLLLQNLQNPSMERSAKPEIITCIADIALAIEGNFDRYLPYVMMMLVQASMIQLDTSDYENTEYLNTLWESIFEAYTGILQGLSAPEHRKEKLFLQFAEPVVTFLDRIAKEEDREESVLRAAVGVVGDMASRLEENNLRQQLRTRPSILHLLESASHGDCDQSTREAAQYARTQIQQMK